MDPQLTTVQNLYIKTYFFRKNNKWHLLRTNLPFKNYFFKINNT